MNVISTKGSKKSSAIMELFLASSIFPRRYRNRLRVMSDDETRKKDKMTSLQSNNIRPGAMQPNTSISRKLREFYDAVQEEGIPDRFLNLLERLEEAEKNAKSVKIK
jgi:hypothetical protein